MRDLLSDLNNYVRTGNYRNGKDISVCSGINSP